MDKGKNVGMVRKVDGLGRIVLPIELRRSLEIELGDPVEYFADDSRLIIRKYRTYECMFCSSTEQLTYFKEYFICSSCTKDASNNGVEHEWEQPMDVIHDTETVSKPALVEMRKTRSKDTAHKLAKIMNDHPHSSQKQWAVLLV
ncbi:AbrB/MazE/SpoVT family DNA-binding domain-containing protein [Paenibacillus illinoisensis]|uniref:Regulators of stationary-sporulation gene expression n=1 Tax=Paenibacillus illinoisensis TaxID=59845 RepID=A0A2W0C9T0_9BACL|nr:AbrB/MazE/SpoVT family DNA-binding domain-containing protein [Paenibacillus illinoisensis]PYY29773.1 Regulators of stationary-sporulation gene expression [Paenibacillus illinoisensis]